MEVEWCDVGGFRSLGVTITNANCINLDVTALLDRGRRMITISIVPRGIRGVGGHVSPVRSRCVRGCFTRGRLGLASALSNTSTCGSTSCIIVTTPAGCSPTGGFFSARRVRSIVSLMLDIGPGTMVIVGDAVPIKCYRELCTHCNRVGLLFSPRFLHRSGTLRSGL